MQSVVAIPPKEVGDIGLWKPEVWESKAEKFGKTLWWTEGPQAALFASYLRGVSQTQLTALLSMVLATAIAVPALAGLWSFLQTDSSFLHPYLAVFLLSGSIGLLALAVLSAFASRRRVEAAIWQLSRIS